MTCEFADVYTFDMLVRTLSPQLYKSVQSICKGSPTRRENNRSSLC
jgi:hypothetical protein